MTKKKFTNDDDDDDEKGEEVCFTKDQYVPGLRITVLFTVMLPDASYNNVQIRKLLHVTYYLKKHN
jgi:hypothetical protein